MVASTRRNLDLVDWLNSVAKRRHALAELPALETVTELVKLHDPLRLKRLGVYLEPGADDVRTWLKVILKVGTLLNLSDPANGTTTLVGLYPIRILHRATWSAITSEGEAKVRSALGIERHCVLLFDEHKLPSDFELFDALYSALDEGRDCCEIDFR